MPSFSAAQRQALADALDAAGPDAPTLCEGWTTHDLAAHVVARERRPDSGPGLMLPALAGWTERVRRHYREQPFDQLVAKISGGPYLFSFAAVPGVDELTNLSEHFVHCEDVRRGREPWSPRDLDPALEERFWRRVRSQAGLATRRSPVGVVLERTDASSVPGNTDAPSVPGNTDARDGGPQRIAVGAHGPHVTLRGRPSELLLHLYNRTSATQVDLDGPAGLVDQFRGVRLGL